MILCVQEKDRDKKEKEKDAKEKDKKAINGHLFTPISSSQATQCSQCNKAFNTKETFHCTRKYFDPLVSSCTAFLSFYLILFHCLSELNCFSSIETTLIVVLHYLKYIIVNLFLI